ncbi:hypothetical protein ILYODFUR_038344 [Ilyodon furcidens]|uniref:Uncharacterized protein n=1 Tax=Ilyodon furcidens TaxID=33524 RepID=A0ABV0UYN1_9TELE
MLRLALGMWNVTSLGGKEHELVREVERLSTRNSRAHLYAQCGLWNPSPREGLDSLLLWSGPRGEAAGWGGFACPPSSSRLVCIPAPSGWGEVSDYRFSLRAEW